MVRATGLVLTFILLAGCAAADTTGPALSINHPAHPEAASTPPRPPSETLNTPQRDQFVGQPDGDPREPVEAGHQAPAAFEGQVGELLRAYFDVARALAEDELEQAHEAMERTQARLGDVDAQLLDQTQRERWEQIRGPLSEGIDRFLAAGGLEPARTAFEPVSEQLEKAVRQFGSGGVASVHLMHCPMAFDNRGADWLQPEAQVNNPYYGSRMLRCGAVTETITGGDDTAPGENQEQHDHH